MPCGCQGQPRERRTSAQLAQVGGGRPTYEVTGPDGMKSTWDLYIDARKEQVRVGGSLREVR
jgi:hypothetical protein